MQSSTNNSVFIAGSIIADGQKDLHNPATGRPQWMDDGRIASKHCGQPALYDATMPHLMKSHSRFP
jgi:hypothetical protein